MRRSEKILGVVAICFGLVVSVPAVARDINPDAPALDWQKAKGSERLEYASMTAIMCQSRNCGGGQIKACIDETTRPPAPAALKTMSIGEVAIACIKILKVQQ